MRRSLLVVDDEEEIRNLVGDFLEKRDIATTRASNGREALALISARDFDVVVCDIRMPGMSGLECLAKCRLRNVRTPFVLLTGYGEVEAVIKAVRLGAADFLMKPFPPEDLYRLVLKMIEIRECENQIERLVDEALSCSGNEEHRTKVETLRFRLGSLTVLYDRER